MAAGGTVERSLEETPTWAVALVCAVFVIISIIIEHGIHSLGKWFQKRQNKAMVETLEKIKADLKPTDLQKEWHVMSMVVTQDEIPYESNLLDSAQKAQPEQVCVVQ